MTGIDPVPVERLAWRCDPGELGFSTTAELAPLEMPIGQERALEALGFALAMRRPGYNVFALGPQGIGRHSIVRRRLEAQAAGEPVPDDWVYVDDFAEPRKPRVLRLPPGRGAVLQREVVQLLGDLLDALRNAFDNEEYRTRRRLIEEELKERQERAVSEVEAQARRLGIALIRSPMGFAFAPMREGRILPPEQFEQLPEPVRQRIEATIRELQEALQRALQRMPEWLKETRERIRRLNDETAAFAVNFLVDSMVRRWAELPQVTGYLEALRRDVIAHVEVFLQIPEQLKPTTTGLDEAHPLFRRYAVNLLVDNGGREAAPVIYEEDPTYERLIGRIEHRAEMGALLTDFLMIRAGALHRANGGYLVIDARKLLARPMAYEALKRALVSGRIHIEPPLQSMGLLTTVTLEPEPVPLDVKVVLVGERPLYYLLAELDPEFESLFKIAADFDEEIRRDGEALALYARLVATVVGRDGLRPCRADGVARLLEEAAREAGDREKLSANLRRMGDLLREADHLAAGAGAEAIAAGHVEAAVEARERRLSRLRERLQEQIREGVIRIATEGAVTGQINGLSVIRLGGYAFGRPSRISARIRMGGGQLVDIEREVKLGGPIHSKGVLILSGYLAANYARDVPLSLAATLVFEQSYAGVDGDSASAAELLALLSAIAEVPLRQNLAVTGAVSQHGEILAVGGVNEKIEGFFDLCAARGLDGSHGVVLPKSNLRHLMLHRRVREAVANGRFAIWAVDRVEEAITLLTGLPAGERGADGLYPEGSFNRLVEDRLRALAERRRQFAVEEKAERREREG